MILFDGQEVSDLPMVSVNSQVGDQVVIGMNKLGEVMRYGTVNAIDEKPFRPLDKETVTLIHMTINYDCHNFKGYETVAFRKDGTIRAW